jgi:hypothetical protein
MKRISFFLGILLVLLFIAVAFLFKIRSVSCTTVDHSRCPEKIQQLLDSLNGSRLFFSGKKLKTVLLNQPEVQSFSTRTSVLGDIMIELTLREAFVALKPESSSVYTLYTKDGVVVKETPETTLPVVVLKEQLSEKEIPFVATLGWNITGVLPVSDMSVEGGALKVTLRDHRIVYYPLSGDIDLLLGATLATFSQLNLTEGKLIIDRQAVEIHEIDLRFKNPVLR